jgi:hypothetical protein
MFNLYRNWLLFAVMQVSCGSTRVFIVGHEGMPSDKNLMNTDYYLNYCYVIMEVSRPEDQQKLIDAGLTTKNPVLINGFIAEPVKKDAQAGETKPFKFTDSNSFVQTKDGSFENQYCMCSGCYHPVPTVVTVPVSQADLDKLNSGQTLEVESGEMVYACENCGNSQQKTYKNLKIWKTITGHTFSFEEAVARARKIKIGLMRLKFPKMLLGIWKDVRCHTMHKFVVIDSIFLEAVVLVILSKLIAEKNAKWRMMFLMEQRLTHRWNLLSQWNKAAKTDVQTKDLNRNAVMQSLTGVLFAEIETNLNI